MLDRLHDGHFAVFSRLKKIDKLSEHIFRLLRINGRTTRLPVIITIQPYSRGSGQTDLTICKLVTSDLRNIDGYLPMSKRRRQEGYGKP